MTLTDSHWFLMIVTNSQWFSKKSGIDSQISLKTDSHQFLMILTDFQWLSPILDDSHWFSMIVADSHQFLMILTNSWWFSPILDDCHWFLMILADSQWFLNKSGIDSWISLKTDSQWFSPIVNDFQISVEFCNMTLWCYDTTIYFWKFQWTFSLFFVFAPTASILYQFSQTRYHFKDKNLLFPNIYKSWWFAWGFDWFMEIIMIYAWLIGTVYLNIPLSSANL